MIPVYVFYSMFGCQRTGDQMWAFGDQLGRGFLLGATAGRTTLTGEGLQHNDGHSVLLASVSPACVAYDAAWAFELAYIVKDALRRMYGATAEYPHGEDIFYYLTVYNEPYPQPPEPADFPGGPQALEQGILRGLYRYRAAPQIGAAGTAGTEHADTERAPVTPVSQPRGPMPLGGAMARRSCWPPTGAWPPTSGRPRPGPSCAARRSAARSTTCCIPTTSRGCRTSPGRWMASRGRWSR